MNVLIMTMAFETYLSKPTIMFTYDGLLCIPLHAITSCLYLNRFFLHMANKMAYLAFETMFCVFNAGLTMIWFTPI